MDMFFGKRIFYHAAVRHAEPADHHRDDPESVLKKRVQTASDTHEKNYGRIMLKVYQEFSKQKNYSS